MRTEISVEDLISELAKDPAELSTTLPLAVKQGPIVLFYLASGAQVAGKSTKEGLTLSQAAKLVGVSHMTIYRRVCKGVITDKRASNGDYCLDPEEVKAAFAP